MFRMNKVINEEDVRPRMLVATSRLRSFADEPDRKTSTLSLSTMRRTNPSPSRVVILQIDPAPSRVDEGVLEEALQSRRILTYSRSRSSRRASRDARPHMD